MYRPRLGSPAGSSRHHRLAVQSLESRLVPTISAPDHLYSFDSGLADQYGGPALQSDGGVVAGGRYTFNANQGLQLTNGLANTSTYSVAMSLQVGSLSPVFKKLLDFQNRTSDNGLYLVGNHLQLYPGPAGTTSVNANTEFQVVLSRDGSTGVTTVYLNGAIQQTYTGFASNVAIPGSNVLRFFEDDSTSGFFEAVSGSADFIAVYDHALSAADAAELAAGTTSVAANQALVSVNEGATASNTGTWTTAAFNPVSLTASVGTITQNVGGTWSWSFATQGNTSPVQPVLITATSNGASVTTSFQLVVNNVAPAVSATQATVTVAEGSVASNSGNWSDVGQDAVALSASVGAITLNSNGSWSWSLATQNGPAESQTVTITATDSDNASSTTTFQLVVNNVAPVVSATSRTVTVTEGGVASNGGSWSDLGQDAVTLTASVGTITKGMNGGWTWSLATKNGPTESQTVTITATDSDGAISTTTFQLVVNNAAPTLFGLTSSVNNTTSVVSLSGSIADAGLFDTHAVTVNWGDGSAPETISNVNQAAHTFASTHHYATAGNFTISVTAADNDGATGSATSAVTVAPIVTPPPTPTPTVGIRVTNGVLTVVGTSGNDFVRIDAVRNCHSRQVVYVVTAIFGFNTRHPVVRVVTYSTTVVQRIVIQGGGGRDRICVDRDVNIPWAIQ